MMHSGITNRRLSKHYKEMGDYCHKYRMGESDTKTNTDLNIIAIYLPQFHPFPENDLAWGKGFTEWTNVASSIPRFIGHHQPVLPSDLGFYDLRIPGKIKEQTELAKKYGLTGFDFYYYWFSGKKIMDMPVETFLADKSIDFRFSLTWANENWARVWNDEPKNIIIEQKYQDSDPLRFIKDIEKFLLDKRYIYVDGKPIITIYRPTDIPNVQNYIKTWRRYWKKEHNSDLFIAYVSNFGRLDTKKYGFDAERSFLPLNYHVYSQENTAIPLKKSQLLDENFSGEIRDMKKIYVDYIEKYLEDDDTRFKCVSPAWDNQARRKGVKGLSFINSSPKLYEKILTAIIKREKKHYIDKEIFVYINAWNEWAEGAMLEPSQDLGHANLVATANAIRKASA